MLVIALIAAPVGLAQSSPSLQPAPALSPTPPTPDQTMRAYNAVDAWVRGWSRPSGEEFVVAGADAAAPLAAPGACITLRWQGQVVGRGVAQAFGPAAGVAKAEGPSTTIARAASAAIAAAEARLPLPNDLSRGEALKQIVPDVMISLELAGDLRPVIADTWADLDTSLNPGLDGLAVTIGKPGEKAAGDAAPAIGVKFPSEMMLANLLPQRAARAMVAAALSEAGAPVGEALIEPKDLREKHGVRVWTFRVGHLAQAKRGEGPKFLFRSAPIAEVSSNVEGIRRIAHNAAIYLHHLTPRNEFDTPAPIDPNSSQDLLRERAIGGYLELIPNDRRNDFRDGPAPSSTTVLQDPIELDGATAALKSLGSLDDWLGYEKPKYIDGPERVRLAAAARVARLYSIQGGFAESVPEAARGLVALALVARAERMRDANWSSQYTASSVSDAVALAESAVRRTFAEAGTDRLASQMPWLGWAELRLVGLKHAIDPSAAMTIPSAIALREMRAQCWKHQLGFTDVNEDSADMLGGIMFTKSGGTPIPTWQCVRPIAFIATMLGDERLTEPSERKQETFRLLLALRFLRQLQADESCGWMYPEPEKAIGGIRAAAWDHTMPPDATSLTLMAVCEAIKSLEKLEAMEGKPTK